VPGFVDLFKTTSNFYIAQPELSSKDIIILVAGTEVMVLFERWYLKERLQPSMERSDFRDL